VTNEQTIPAGPARIAVIIPCYHDGELAAETVASVREQEPIELVVIDDGSDDAPTKAALDRLESDRVRVVRHEHNLGLSAARSTGLRVTNAPFVFPLDADDLAVPDVLGQMADRLDEHPEAGVCYGDYAQFEALDRVRTVPARIDPFRLAYTNEYPVSALFRRSVLESVGAWHEIEAYEDWYLWMTLAERGVTGVHFGFGLVTYRHRVHVDTVRMLATARTFHQRLYSRLRADHPRLFDELPAHRRRSPLHPIHKRLYPVVYGRRPRFSWDYRVKNLFERLGIWTVQR
jgi:glycosyltransferase involved in cell wall biosynthesis